MTPNTVLTVSEDIADEDYDSLSTIQYKALLDEPAIKACYPGGLEDYARSQNVTRVIKALRWKDPSVAAAKVIDDETKDICVFATMRVYDENPFLAPRMANSIYQKSTRYSDQ